MQLKPPGTPPPLPVHRPPGHLPLANGPKLTGGRRGISPRDANASSLFVRVAERLAPDYNFRLAPIDLVNIYLTVKCQTHTHTHSAAHSHTLCTERNELGKLDTFISGFYVIFMLIIIYLFLKTLYSDLLIIV